MSRFFLFLALLCLKLAVAQDGGYLQFVGHNFYEDQPLPNTDIKVLKAGVTYTAINTGSSRDFKIRLPFGAIYDLYLTNRKAQPMYLRIMADQVPQSQYNLVSTYELKVPFFPVDARSFDASAFKDPFHKIYFYKNRFVDDTAYMNDFLNRVYVKIVADTAVPQAPVIKPQTGTLVGNIMYDTKDKTPVQGRTVVLETKDGKEISTARTTKNGTFVFQYTVLEEAYRIRVKFDGTDNPPNQKIILGNSNHEVIETATIGANKEAAFDNTTQNNMVKRLVDNVFAYKIAGKLAANDGVKNKVVTDKYVYLLTDKNVLVQKVKTNALGMFLFTNVKPNHRYAIAVEDKDIDCARCKLVLFNVKDKKLRVIDSLTQNKFVYKFLAVPGAEFNELLVDDVELKMNVKGKMYGNNTNNPLSEMKILLLNDKYEPVDTAVTTKDGGFSFKRAPYLRQIILSADNKENGILESFNNIMVYDNSDNLVKIVSLVKGSKFNYKPLTTEQSRITEAYVDDPWLTLVDKDRSRNLNVQNMVIVENILFDFDKADILPQASQTLDKAVMAMQLNPSLNIELSAHTDSKGSDAYNLKLSEARAQNVKQYFVQKGISEDRIKAIGYGETRLLNGCGNKAVCPEEEHAANRRLEFRFSSAN